MLRPLLSNRLALRGLTHRGLGAYRYSTATAGGIEGNDPFAFGLPPPPQATLQSSSPQQLSPNCSATDAGGLSLPPPPPGGRQKQPATASTGATSAEVLSPEERWARAVSKSSRRHTIESAEQQPFAGLISLVPDFWVPMSVVEQHVPIELREYCIPQRLRTTLFRLSGAFDYHFNSASFEKVKLSDAGRKSKYAKLEECRSRYAFFAVYRDLGLRVAALMEPGLVYEIASLQEALSIPSEYMVHPALSPIMQFDPSLQVDSGIMMMLHCNPELFCFFGDSAVALRLRCTRLDKNENTQAGGYGGEWAFTPPTLDDTQLPPATGEPTGRTTGAAFLRMSVDEQFDVAKGLLEPVKPAIEFLLGSVAGRSFSAWDLYETMPDSVKATLVSWDRTQRQRLAEAKGNEASVGLTNEEIDLAALNTDVSVGLFAEASLVTDDAAAFCGFLKLCILLDRFRVRNTNADTNSNRLRAIELGVKYFATHDYFVQPKKMTLAIKAKEKLLKDAYLAQVMSFNPLCDKNNLIAAVHELLPPEGARINVDELRTQMRPQMAAALPGKGLLPFLRANPHHFHVEDLIVPWKLSSDVYVARATQASIDCAVQNNNHNPYGTDPDVTLGATVRALYPYKNLSLVKMALPHYLRRQIGDIGTLVRQNPACFRLDEYVNPKSKVTNTNIYPTPEAYEKYIRDKPCEPKYDHVGGIMEFGPADYGPCPGMPPPAAPTQNSPVSPAAPPEDGEIDVESVVDFMIGESSSPSS